MAPGPKTDLCTRRGKRSFGRGSVELRCEEAEAVLRIPFCSFQIAVFSAQTLKLFFHCFADRRVRILAY